MYEGHALSRELADPKEKEKRLARLTELEDQVLDMASGVILASLDFSQVSPHATEPPPEWVTEYGEAGARQRLEVAKAGWLPASLQPSGVKLATQVYVGISRARGHKISKLTQINLNAQVISLPAPTAAAMPGAPVFPEKEMDEG